ncbi:MAG: low specificity L-threonine aldolase [Bacteroides sp.]|jgi:threonine aldolase|nr:low specificity L-threonine aldolase [Bacteroides sp.]
MPDTRSFASDNNAPVHEAVFQAMLDANRGDVIAYGDDPYTADAEQKFREHFGPDTRVFFVFNGTGANVSALSHLTRPWQAIITSETAHIENDECGAPEKFSGCKLHILSAPDGKIRVEQIKPLMHSVGFQHHSQPRVVSITQATEMGTVYTPAEISDIARYAHENNMLLHMDGARIANAAAALGISFREMVTDTGVDVLSFGGTKNGILLGEAVVFLKGDLGKDFEYVRKQSMQLASKMRYISAQFNALLTNDLWLHNARHANRMAQLLAEKVRDIPQVQVTQKVEINGVFAIVPKTTIEKLRKKYFFYMWNETRSEVRWMTSFATTEEDIEKFVEALKEAL